MKKHLLILFGLLLALPMYARDFTFTYEGVTLHYTVIDKDSKTCSVGSYSGALGVVIIPAVASDGTNEYSVTSIGSYAFHGCSGLTSVTIPNSVTSIGDYAFNCCNGLTSVTIPNSVTSIGDYAFGDCWRLTSVTIPNSVTSIGRGAFQSCRRLPSIEVAPDNAMYSSLSGVLFNKDQTELLQYPGGKSGAYEIPNSVTSIGRAAFWGCSGLTSVTIPNSVTSIGDYAFNCCNGLTSIEVAPDNAMYSSLSGVLFNKDLTELLQCPGGKSGAYEIPNSVTSIGNDAFKDCSGLTSVTIPNSVTSIGEWTFSGCRGLTSVTIPNSVTSIGRAAFYGCSGLTSVTIPNSVTSIGEEAFSYCDRLKSIRMMGDFPPIFNGMDLCSDNVYAIATLEIPQGTFEKYAGTVWGKFQNIVVGGVATKTFNDGVFNYRLLPDIETPTAVLIPGDYSAMEEVSIPERFADDSDPDNPVRYTIIAIGAGAFKNCSNLKILNFNPRTKLASIGDEAFLGCSGLTSVTIPNSVTSIGHGVFYGCSGLRSVTIPNSVTSIGSHAFHGCSGLTSVTIPNSVTSIGDYAFYGCSGLTSVTIPNSVTSIGDYAFYGCSGLTSVTIPNSVTSIGSHAFHGCSGLTSVTIPNSVTTIGDHAFYDCSGLTSVTIPNSVTSIGDYAFCGCSGLTSVTIPNSVTSIGNYVFSSCFDLCSLIIPNSVTSIGHQAFFCCLNLRSVTIPNSVTSIGHGVFDQGGIKTLTVADGRGTLRFDPDNSWLADVTKLYMGRDMAYTTGAALKLPAVSDLTIGNEVTEVGASMFADCQLTEVSLGSGLTTIGSNAFAGCRLTEVVVPPSVERIEASAFAGNSGLANVIMGHRLKSIGEKAYDGCRVDEVYITATTPPTAPNNTFSRYSGRLWVPNAQAVEAYYDAYTCWDRFAAYAMIEPEEITIEGAQGIDAVPGDTIQLTAAISPANVTLPQVFWRSTNPDIATVDNNGRVVVHAVEPDIRTYSQWDDDYADGGCRIIAETLYADAPIASVAINAVLADIEDIVVERKESQAIDYAKPYDVYNMQGVWLGGSIESVASGFYIIRQGSNVAKVAK